MIEGGLRLAGGDGPEQLSVRTARKEGRQVVTMRSVQHPTTCVVDCQIYPVGALQVEPLTAGPYTFATAREATAFVDEAVQALTCLGCEVA